MSAFTDNRLTKRGPRSLSGSKRHREMGKSKIKQGLYNDALDSFKASIRIDAKEYPDILSFLYRRLRLHYDNVPLRIVIAELYAFVKRTREALDELEEAYEIAPNEPSIYPVLGKLYHKGGHKTRIRHLLESAIDANIYESAILDILPKIYFEDCATEKNTRLYEKLIEAFPDQTTYYKILSELYLRNRQYEESADIISKLLKKAPFTAQELIDFVAKLVAHSPRSLKVREVMIHCAIMACKPLDAVTHIQELLRHHPNLIEKMIPHLKKANELYPDTFEVLVALSSLLTQLKEYSESVRYLSQLFEKQPEYSDQIIPPLEAIIAKYPDQSMALMLLGDIYYKQDQFRQSIYYYDRLVDLNSLDLPELSPRLQKVIESPGAHCRFQAMLVLAKIHFYQHHYDEAIHLCEALSTTEEGLASMILKAKVYIQKKEVIHARQVLVEALKVAPYHWEIHEQLHSLSATLIGQATDKILTATSTYTEPIARNYDLGIQFLAQGHLDQAIDHFNKVPEAHILRTPTQFLLGRSYMEKGTYGEALNYFDALTSNPDISADIVATYSQSCINMAYGAHQAILKPDHRLIVIPENGVHGKLIPWVITHPSPPQEEDQTVSFAQTHLIEGTRSVIQGHWTEADNEYRQAVNMDAGISDSVLYQLSMSLLTSRSSDTKQYLDQANTSSADPAILHYLKAIWCFTQKNYSDAMTHIETCLNHRPEMAPARLFKGDIHSVQRQLEPCFSEWRKALQLDVHLFWLIQRRTLYLVDRPINSDFWLEELGTPLSLSM
ncbi:tetratricopeptide repeat protein [bacterium]|jgi:tetratricopeptide (TPR) repeat protein|nr:tetratricopeptide repeat protein [bacterium]